MFFDVFVFICLFVFFCNDKKGIISITFYKTQNKQKIGKRTNQRFRIHISHTDPNLPQNNETNTTTTTNNNINAMTTLSNVLIDFVSDDDIETEVTIGYSAETKKSKCLTRVMAMVALKLNSWLVSSFFICLLFFVCSI